jgi:hypothetical protein
VTREVMLKEGVKKKVSFEARNVHGEILQPCARIETTRLTFTD